MIAVDTNVLIRLAVDDDRQQSEVAARLVRDNRLFGVSLHASHGVAYHSYMQVVSGTVVGGKVVVEGLSLPEGTAVTILARGDEAVVKLSRQKEAELLAALDEADREEGIPAEEFLARLRRFG